MQNPEWVALYPDLVQSGGLSSALQRLFRQLSADVNVAEEIWFGNEAAKVSPGWAFVRKGSRNSQVCTAQQQRAFDVEFRNRGFMYGEGRTRDLTEVARAIEIFLVQEGSTARMKAEFSWFVDKGGDRILQEPAASFVTKRWQSLERSLKSEELPFSLMRDLIPLVSELPHDHNCGSCYRLRPYIGCASAAPRHFLGFRLIA